MLAKLVKVRVRTRHRRLTQLTGWEGTGGGTLACTRGAVKTSGTCVGWGARWLGTVPATGHTPLRFLWDPLDDTAAASAALCPSL